MNVTKRKFKLPTIELKKFGGKVKDWLTFWGQFKKIDGDPDIDETDKFQYLLQATSTKAPGHGKWWRASPPTCRVIITRQLSV